MTCWHSMRSSMLCIVSRVIGIYLGKSGDTTYRDIQNILELAGTLG
jgi:hypothetical protein